MKKWKVYTILAGSKEGENFWHEIGRAFENKDGSINVRLNSLPFTRKIQLREIEEETREPGEDSEEMEDPSPQQDQEKKPDPGKTPF